MKPQSSFQLGLLSNLDGVKEAHAQAKIADTRMQPRLSLRFIMVSVIAMLIGPSKGVIYL